SAHHATTAIYTLSLHDALPISIIPTALAPSCVPVPRTAILRAHAARFLPRQFRPRAAGRLHSLRPSSSRKARLPETQIRLSVERSEEHTSELQSRSDLVCRLLL